MICSALPGYVQGLQPLWSAFDGYPVVTLRIYPNLNHLLQEGEGVSTPDEYAPPMPVASAVIADPAAWIKAQK